MKPNRTELAAVLKRARERVRPEDVGMPAGLNRRVPGLRREEVAMLAGVSVDYVVRLEQARGPHPSEQVMGSLARALRLDDDERDHLFSLAGVARPQLGRISLHVKPSVLRLIDRFEDLPAMVVSAKGDILAWNPMSAALHGDWTRIPLERRNQLRIRFLADPRDPELAPLGGSPAEVDATVRQAVASLRTASGRYPDDPGLQRLVADLQAGSAEFRDRWATTPARCPRTHRKTLVHPSLGPITLDCDTLLLPDEDQMLVVLSAAAGTSEAEALALLRVIGTQQLAPDSAR